MATPLFNTRNRQGVHLRTLNANFANLFEIVTKPNTAYQFEVRITGKTISGVASPAAYAYWRRALYQTDSTGALTLVGSIQTPAADLETDAGASVAINISGTSIIGTVSAAFPTDWVADAYIGVADDINLS